MPAPGTAVRSAIAVIVLVVAPAPAQVSYERSRAEDSLRRQATLGIADADLVAESVDIGAVTGDWQSLQLSGTVTALVRNDGSMAAGPFEVLFFDDTDLDGMYTPGVDVELTSSVVAGLDPDVTITVDGVMPTDPAPIVEFRGDLILALVDALDEVPESNEMNNVASSGDSCETATEPGDFDPVLEWSWEGQGPEEFADWQNVMNTPVIIDLTGDGTPDVSFGSTSSTGGGMVEVGVLRALDGGTGAHLWTVTDATYRVNAASNFAAADIDLDGMPEIVAVSSQNNRLLCFEHDGTPKATWNALADPGFSELIDLGSNWSAVAIADLDADGTPELFCRRTAFRADGSVFWSGSAGQGGDNVGAIPVIADVDVDGFVDVVSGNTIYYGQDGPTWSAGDIKTQNVGVGDGTVAVANLDGDMEAEIVIVGGRVELLDHDLTTKPGWPVTPPGLGTGGPPTIADYDGDGEVEIGVAGASRYTVLEADGSILWSAVTQDSSSNRTGSSVFDFEGDGAAEVVYRDELFLRVYDGGNGDVLFQTAASSCTWHEYVQVADVDADGNAEIIAVANNNCGFGPQRGVLVYGDASDAWVATRQLWNQHAYSITNVNDDGSIPTLQQPNWLFPVDGPFNNFRQNLLTTGQPPAAAPDITASFLRVCDADTGGDEILARIGNGGAIFIPPGIPTTFFDGDPAMGAASLGTVLTTQVLPPGEFEDVSLVLAVPVPGPEVFVRADDDGSGGIDPVGMQSECDETNNTHSATVPTIFAMAIDIYPGRDDNPIILSVPYTIYVAVLSSRNIDATNIDPNTVRFGPTGTEAAPVGHPPILVDYDDDGRLDRLFGFLTDDAGFALGDRTGVLTGLSFDCVELSGEDLVFVSP